MIHPAPPGPGFLDLQVNGYAGVDFNQDRLSAESLNRACKALERDGIAGILATLITERLGLMESRLRNMRKLLENDPLARRLIAGFHLEGPFLNPAPGFRGAHPEDAIIPADPESMKRLLHAAGGLVRLVTLAPEKDPGLKTTRLLVREGVAVSAGHCDPSLDQLESACDAGLTLFTHLGNGCPAVLARHDNIIQRALSLRDRLRLCFIADGAHVPFPALGNYIRAAGLDRCLVVTDAIAPAGLGPGRYTVGRWTLDIGEDMIAWAPDRSHLVGAAVTMKKSAENLRTHLGLTEAEVKKLCVENPRAAVPFP